MVNFSYLFWPWKVAQAAPFEVHGAEVPWLPVLNGGFFPSPTDGKKCPKKL